MSHKGGGGRKNHTGGGGGLKSVEKVSHII